MRRNGWKESKLTSGAISAGAFTGRFIILVAFGGVLLLSSCGESRNRTDLAARMAAEEGKAEDDQRIAELKADIRGSEKLVEKTIEAVRDEGTYWRLLGMKYMDYRMWGSIFTSRWRLCRELL